MLYRHVHGCCICLRVLYNSKITKANTRSKVSSISQERSCSNNYYSHKLYDLCYADLASFPGCAGSNVGGGGGGGGGEGGAWE